MMRTLAVTGGIGSGKSYVVRMFAALGVPVYDADTRTKDLYIADKELLGELESILGGPLVRNGVLDSKYMASRIFQDPALLSRVEAAVFPRVIGDFRRWKDSVPDGGSGFVIMESAIYLEKPVLAGTADKVLTVLCPQETRVERVMIRSGMSRSQVLERMANQWDDRRRSALSDFTVISDFRHPLLPQVYDIYLKMKLLNN